MYIVQYTLHLILVKDSEGGVCFFVFQFESRVQFAFPLKLRRQRASPSDKRNSCLWLLKIRSSLEMI